jgi:NADPH2:quinone reductase
MKALVFDGPAPDTRASRVAELAAPEPAPGAVSIDVHYAGVNFKDVMARRGDPGYVPSWPFVPGLEVAGIVRALSSGVSTLEVGDRVTAFTDHGGLAEVAVAPAELTVRVPAGLDLERAAAAPGALTTAALLLSDFGRLRQGEIVLVHSAAGAVGQAVVRLARLAGAELVLGTVGNPTRVPAATRAGYDDALVRGPGLTSAIRERTGGRLIDLILDPQGTSMLDLDLDVLAAGGRIVLFGNATGATLDPLPAASRLFAANASIAGFSLAALATTAPGRVAGAMRDVLNHLAGGELDIELTPFDGLDAAPEAQQALAEGRGRGKQIVRVTAR